MNTIKYSPEAVRYMQQMFPWAHPRPRSKRHLDRFSRYARLTRWQIDWPDPVNAKL